MEDPNIQEWRESSRFKALLSASRDATPWAVNIANELAEYVESVGISLSDVLPPPSSPPPAQPDDDDDPSSVKSVNFAKAALIVQGSVSIYSRKVDQLYSLVFKVMDSHSAIHKKPRDRGGDTNDGPGDDDNGRNGDTFSIDEVDLLLELDDGGDIADKFQQRRDGDSDRERANGHDTDEEENEDPTRLPHVPPMLRENVNIGLPGQSMDSANFKIRSAVTHSSGALLTDGCPPVDEDLALAPTRRNLAMLGTDPDNNHLTNDFDDDHDDDIAPPDDFDNDDAPPLVSQTLESDPFAFEPPAPQSDDPPAFPDDVNPIAVDERQEEKPVVINPFAPADRHEACPERVCVVRPKISLRHPRAASTRRGETLLDLDKCDYEDVKKVVEISIGRVPRGARLTSYVCNWAVRGAVQRTVRRRRRRRTMAKAKDKPQRAPVHLMGIDDDADDTFDDGDADSDTEIQVTRGAGDGLPGGGGEEDVQLFGDGEIELGLAGFGGGDEDAFAGGVPDAEPPVAPEADGGENGGGELARLASSYANACQQYVSRTAWMWERRVVDTGLITRVEEWSERIAPVLRLEEERNDFDIHAYGQLLIDRIQKERDASRLRMSSVVRENEKYQVCRLFLSTLQMVNDGRIDLQPAAGASAGLSDPWLGLTEDEQAELVETDGEENGTKQVDPENGPGTPVGMGKERRKRFRVVTPVHRRRRGVRARLDVELDIGHDVDVDT